MADQDNITYDYLQDYLKEYNISIIIEFDLKKNMGRNYFINVITVLPGRKGENIISFIDID